MCIITVSLMSAKINGQCVHCSEYLVNTTKKSSFLFWLFAASVHSFKMTLKIKSLGCNKLTGELFFFFRASIRCETRVAKWLELHQQI